MDISVNNTKDCEKVVIKDIPADINLALFFTLQEIAAYLKILAHQK